MPPRHVLPDLLPTAALMENVRGYVPGFTVTNENMPPIKRMRRLVEFDEDGNVKTVWDVECIVMHYDLATGVVTV